MKWIKTILWAVSSFTSGSYSLIVFLFSLRFWLLSHFKKMRCIVKSLIAASTHFLSKYDWKKKFLKFFLGARVWVPKGVYQSPKRAWICHWTNYLCNLYVIIYNDTLSFHFLEWVYFNSPCMHAFKNSWKNSFMENE